MTIRYPNPNIPSLLEVAQRKLKVVGWWRRRERVPWKSALGKTSVSNQVGQQIPHCLFWRFCLFLAVLSLCCCTGFALVVWVGLLSSAGAQASHCSGLFCGAWVLGAWASVLVAHGLRICSSWAVEHKLNSCSTWILLLQGMWDLLRPETEPVLPVLAGGFFTTEPPRSPSLFFHLHSLTF